MKGAGVLRRLRAAEGTPYTACGLLLGEGAPSIAPAASSPTAPCVLPSPLRLLRALPRDAPSATLSAAPTLCRSSSAARCAGGGNGGGEATSQLSASPAVNSSYSTMGAAAKGGGCGGRLGAGCAAVGVDEASADCAGSAAAVAPRRPGKRRRERTKAAGESTAPLPEGLGCWDSWDIPVDCRIAQRVFVGPSNLSPLSTLSCLLPLACAPRALLVCSTACQQCRMCAAFFF